MSVPKQTTSMGMKGATMDDHGDPVPSFDRHYLDGTGAGTACLSSGGSSFADACGARAKASRDWNSGGFDVAPSPFDAPRRVVCRHLSDRCQSSCYDCLSPPDDQYGNSVAVR